MQSGHTELNQTKPNQSLGDTVNGSSLCDSTSQCTFLSFQVNIWMSVSYPEIVKEFLSNQCWEITFLRNQRPIGHFYQMCIDQRWKTTFSFDIDLHFRFEWRQSKLLKTKHTDLVCNPCNLSCIINVWFESFGRY